MRLSKHTYIPVVIFIGILVLGQLGLFYINGQKNEKLEIKTQITAEQGGIRLSEFLNTRLTRLDFLRERMESKPFLNESEFRSRALLLQNELSGFQAINWIDADGIIQWVTPLSTNLPAVGADLVEKAASGAVDVFSRARLYQIDTSSPRIELLQGGTGFAIYLPIVVDDDIKGFLNGVFRIEELISQCYGNTIRDFNYEVLLSGQRVFLRGEPQNFDNPLVIGRHNFTLLGQSWEFQIVPGSSDESTVSVMHGLALFMTASIALLLAGYTRAKMRSSEELARAYKIVENSESKFRTIFDKSPACLIRFGSRGTLTDWNLEAASLFGFEFPPQRRRELDELSEMKPIKPAIQEVLSGKTSKYAGVLEIQGRKVEVDASFESLLSSSEQIQGGIILLKDVTEQNQVTRARAVMYEIGELTNRLKDLPELFEAIQKSLSAILDTRNFYVALYNEETDEFTYPYYKDEFDSPPPEPIKGEKGISAYVIKNAIPQLLSKDEFYTMNSEGKIDLLGTPSEQWLGCPLIVEGKPIGIMAVQSYSKEVIYDGTDMGMMNFVSDQIALTIKINIEDEKLRNSEAMHRELSAKLSDSNNIKALLLDILSHDLKNPAGVISSMAEMLTSEENVSEEVQLIKDSSDALLKVIENTTALAHVTIGEKIAMQELNLSQLLVDVVEEFRPSFTQEGKRLDVEIEPMIICPTNAIITEIFRNYLSNALKYAPAGAPVSVSLKRDQKSIEFHVADTGKTIGGKDQTAIFKRSVQLANGKLRGSGLGLAIVNRIAEAHGANVGVKPNTPQGNIFYLELPNSPQVIENNETGKV